MARKIKIGTRVRPMWSVYVEVGQTNRNPVGLADTARRQANYCGPDGFLAMRGQKDGRFARKGNHRLVFEKKASAIEFQDRVEEFCDPAITTRRCRVTGKLALRDRAWRR